MQPSDRRRHERKYIAKTTECVLPPPSQNEMFDCIVADISESGVRLLTTQPIENGQKITMMNHFFPSPRTAIVRWSEKYKGLYYRFGLEFN
jgi:hypothetical protein